MHKTLVALMAAVVWIALTAPALAAKLLVSSFGTDQMIRYGEDGAFVDLLVDAGATPLDGPTGMTIGPDGLLYVASFNNHGVYRFNATTGSSEGAFIPAGTGGLNGPHDLLFLPDGTLLVANYHGDNITRYDAAGASLGVFIGAGGGTLNGPTFMTLGPDGHLYISSAVNAKVQRYNASTGAFINSFVAFVLEPRDLCFAMSNGKMSLFVSSIGFDAVFVYHFQTGEPQTSWSEGGELFDPQGLVVSPTGELLVTSANHQVNRFNLQTGSPQPPLVSAGSGGLIGPIGLVIAPDPPTPPKEPACDGDINADGEVDGADLGLLLGAWGSCE